MKSIAVSFSSGRDVLNAYWGFLSNGGLVIRDAEGLREGDHVALEVTIQSSQQQYRLAGQVVRREQLASKKPLGDDHAVIAFAPGEPHDLLLSAAWAETDNVPARRERRFPVEATIHFRAGSGAEGDVSGRLLNLSFGGCCLRTVSGSAMASALPSGAAITLVTKDGHAVKSVVRWSRAADLGLEFDAAQDRESVEAFVRQFL